jgi:hypothetical protein
MPPIYEMASSLHGFDITEDALSAGLVHQHEHLLVAPHTAQASPFAAFLSTDRDLRHHHHSSASGRTGAFQLDAESFVLWT